MRISFKNVGHGDSIILEWFEKGENKIGIIDCCKYKQQNAVVNHLHKIKPQQIEFIILSHPHKDHYSGLLELFYYCVKSKVTIKRFAHTMAIHPISLYNWTSLEDKNRKLLRQILDELEKLYDIGIIIEKGPIVQNWNIKLTNDIELKCLSPSDIELNRFKKRINYFKEINDFECSISANFLSTILKLYSRNWSVLFTSDATEDTFKRILARHSENLKENILILGQVPHHGSKYNHYINFWLNLEMKKECPAIISAGGRHAYHPDFEVVKDFEGNNYKIYVTNLVNGARKYFMGISKTALSTSIKLDDISYDITRDDLLGNDQVFEIDSDKINCLTPQYTNS